MMPPPLAVEEIDDEFEEEFEAMVASFNFLP
jgi:hypothetical protein